MKKRPMTTAELFEKICGILKEKDRMPEILDYALADHGPVSILDYQYDLKSNLTCGGCEGGVSGSLDRILPGRGKADQRLRRI